jgi:DNA polymerase-3 subunit delta'
MTNWNLLGHQWAVDLLRAQIQRGTLSHAYLFTGPSGVGRRTLALRFAQALLCPESPAPGDPCGTCRTCCQIEAMQYPDLTVIQAEKEGGVLKVEQVREVRQMLSLKPYQSHYRVALFLRFEEANPSAANALLKTLEEAPSHALLLLTADSPDSLLPTIVSRCQVLRLSPSPLETVEAALHEHGADPETAHLLAHLSGGRVGLAFRLLADPDSLDFRRQRIDELHRLLTASRVEKFAYAERLTDRKHAEKERPRETLLLWLSYWRDVLLAASGTSAPLMNVDRAEEIHALARQLGLDTARRLTTQAEKAIQQLDANVNPRLLVEVTLLDWPHV